MLHIYVTFNVCDGVMKTSSGGDASLLAAVNSAIEHPSSFILAGACIFRASFANFGRMSDGLNFSEKLILD